MICTGVLGQGGISPVDWFVVFLYGVSMIVLGWWCSKRQSDTEEYFIAGGGMGAFTIGISQVATLVSSLSYLAAPGEVIKYGPMYIGMVFSLPIAYLIVGYVVIPRLMKVRVTSAYALLEEKLGRGGRLLGASMFVLLRLTWMAVLVYVAVKAMVVMFGLGDSSIPWVTIILGIVAVAYTTLGGFRAVVISDVVQFFLLLFGVFLVLWIVTQRCGGVMEWWPAQWNPQWHRDLIPDSLLVRSSLLGITIHHIAWYVATATGDQTSIQRFMATKSAQKARQSYLICMLSYAVLTPLLGLAGFALMGFYTQFPDQISDGLTADFYFPHFIATHMPPIIAGLVVSALCAATMSSLDSGISSISAVIMTDFIDCFRKSSSSERTHVKEAKYLAGIIGLVVVLGSVFVGYVKGNILDVSFKTINLLSAPLFGLFFVALFLPFGTLFGAIWGVIYGAVGAIYLAFWDVLATSSTSGWQSDPPQTPVQWITVGSLLVTILGCVVFSLIPVKKKNLFSSCLWSVILTIPIVLWIVFVAVHLN